jgi:hypothetical protein
MPRVGFEPTIPAFEGAKTIHALERAATVISKFYINKLIYCLITSMLKKEAQFSSETSVDFSFLGHSVIPRRRSERALCRYNLD